MRTILTLDDKEVLECDLGIVPIGIHINTHHGLFLVESVNIDLKNDVVLGARQILTVKKARR